MFCAVCGDNLRKYRMLTTYELMMMRIKDWCLYDISGRTESIGAEWERSFIDGSMLIVIEYYRGSMESSNAY